ncbi:MAG: NFACT family protein [Candidatus Diapherotrites archaeon]|nr:NFACT family protein [Candidatus Diapherotrites archaeon]
MQITNLTLAYAVLEAKELLEGSTVKKVQELENNWLKIRLHSKQGSKDLIVTQQILFFATYSVPAKQQSSGFGGFLRKHLEGKRILKAEQHNFDRVVVLEFADYFLVLELFAKGNVILADKAMKILGVARREHWKDRVLEKGAPYKFPASKGLDPLSPEKALEAAVKSSDAGIASALIRSANIAPLIAEEILFRAALPKDRPAQTISQNEFKKISNLMREFYSVEKKKLAPVLAEKNSEKIILPFPLSSAKGIQKFDSLNSAFSENFSALFLESKKQKGSAVSDKKISELKHSISLQEKSVAEFGSKIELNRKKGEAIYAHYAELARAIETIHSGKGADKKTIMYKLSGFGFVTDLDLKKRQLTVEFAD